METQRLKDLIPIREVKEDFNLFLFNYHNLSLTEMKEFNQLVEAIANVKIQINNNN